MGKGFSFMSSMKPIYVIGHRNPDTDTICSAIAYAALKRAGGEDAVAARTGPVNAETKYALEYFGAEAPMFLSDLYPRVKDIMLTNDTVVRETDTLHYLGEVMQKNALRSVPVTDAEGILAGIVTVSDLAQRYFEEINMQNLDKAGVTLRAVISITESKVLVPEDEKALVQGTVRIVSGSRHTVEKLIHPGDVVLVGEGRYESMMEILQHNISCLIITDEGKVADDVLKKAKKNHILVARTPYDAYTAARLINQCVPVGYIMKKNMISFEMQQLLSDIKGTIASTNFRNYPVVENGRLIGLVSRDNLMVPEPERVILVDHNERGQAIEGIENARIVEIIDHHRLGGMQTGEPIYIREEPVGCTATIIANMYWQNEVEISPTIAGLLLSAIISDTVLFKSPTCTAYDTKTAERLAALAGVKMVQYGMDMLKAGSGIGTMSPMEIAKKDMKEFQFGDYHVLISQISVMGYEEVMKLKEQLLESMTAVCEQEGFDLSLLMVTNILEESTELLYVGSPKTLIGDAFQKNAAGNSIFLPGVMSRKKQIVPPLSEAVRQLQL